MRIIIIQSALRFMMQLLISESIFVLSLEKKRGFFLRLPLALLGCFGGAVLWYELLDRLFSWQAPVQILYYLGMYGMTLLAIRGCFQASPLQILFAGTGGYATEHLAFSAERLLRYLVGFEASSANPLIDNLLFRFLVYAVTAWLVYQLVVKPQSEERGISPTEARVRIARTSMVLMMVAVILSVYCRMETTVNPEIFYLIYGGVFCWSILQISFGVLRENRFTLEREMMEQLFQISNQQQKNSQETIDIINRKCHDLKHQIRAMQRSQGEWGDYLQKMQEAVSAMEASYHTGNRALDYILQEKTLLFGKYKIVFSCQADGTAIGFMRSPDIYALFGNILDNAWESVLREPEGERIISLLIRKTGEE